MSELRIPALVTIEPGEFVMGESACDKFANDTERPAHRVRIERRFGLGRFPITVGEYREFAPGHAPTEDPALSVVNVSWEEAVAYCRWLGERTGRAFRLPREAEWEFACRAGTATPFSTGGEISPDQANYLYDEHGLRIGRGSRSPEGCYPPNPWGLHDMHGNVCEWVEDAWRPGYDTPAASADSRLRVIRGGAWDYLPRLLRSSWRDFLRTDARRDNTGFRVAADLPD